MRFLVFVGAIGLHVGLADAESVEFKFAEFQDRSDLAALSQEIMTHEISDTDFLLRISISYRFETLQLAETACDFVWSPPVRAIASGTADFGNCAVSLNGIPTPHSLLVLREAAQPVAELAGTEARRWMVSREATAIEKGDVPRGATVLTAQN